MAKSTRTAPVVALGSAVCGSRERVTLRCMETASTQCGRRSCTRSQLVEDMHQRTYVQRERQREASCATGSVEMQSRRSAQALEEFYTVRDTDGAPMLHCPLVLVCLGGSQDLLATSFRLLSDCLWHSGWHQLSSATCTWDLLSSGDRAGRDCEHGPARFSWRGWLCGAAPCDVPSVLLMVAQATNRRRGARGQTRSFTRMGRAEPLRATRS